jgi:Type II secretion system (T2SS), protein M subtype b
VTLGTLDRKTFIALAAAAGAVLLAILRLAGSGGSGTAVVSATQSIPQAEQRLARLRQLAATAPGKEELLKQVSAELKTREAGILQADTAAQAQAQLLDTIHRIASQNGFDARGAEELREPRPLGNDYGEVSVAETFTCGIDQLVNFLADLDREPHILATNEIHISGGNDKKKNLQVRLSLSGVVPRKLVPVKKQAVAF